MRCYGCLGLAGTLVLAIGCGSGGPELGTVEGTVTLDGSPLPDADVVFEPEKGRTSFGRTDSSGHYTLQYTPERPGAVLGSHTVRVTTARTTEKADGTDEKSPEKVPAKYNTNSSLKREVKAGENVIDLGLGP